MKNKKPTRNRKRIEKLFNRLEDDIAVIDELLDQHHGIDGKHGEFTFVEKAALLRNIEAESRTRLAWIRTWLAVIALIAGGIALLLLVI